MPIKRMNYTSRKRLTREAANVVIHPAADPAEPATFDVNFDFASLRPEANEARIFVEAYHQTTRMRFDFGTVAIPVVPPPARRRLVEFTDWRDVQFRVKVTDVTAARGRIIAWANRIKPQGPDDHEEDDLVRFRDDDLEGLLWDLEFEEKGPVVRIERNAGGAQRIGRDNCFIASVYPEIFRRSLERALLEEEIPHDDEDHWFGRWYEGFLKAKLYLSPPPPPDQKQGCKDWIADAVRAFARRNQFAQHWPTQVEIGELP